MNPRTKQGREELRVLCANATPGPWQVKEEDIPANEKAGHNWSNAIFIARARTALPEALDALEAAEAVIEAARVLTGRPHPEPFQDDCKGCAFDKALAAYDAKKGSG